MQNIFDFLKALTTNNNRDWFLANKEQYQLAKDTYTQFIKKMILEIAKFDPAVMDLKPKDCIFRINRDVRFSNNKNPYKTNFGAAITPGGKKALLPTYYIHLEPGLSFVAGGLYQPDADILNKVRQEIDYHSDEFKSIVQKADFLKTFTELAGEKLKKAPKGYPKDHSEIEWLKHKSFIVQRKLTNDIFIGSNPEKLVSSYFKVLYPLNQFLTRAISE